jgi:AcrR family transcriptional regulator
LAPQRLDARRNREAILRVADEAFSQDVDAVALDEIARRAGLGRATVYRHFPDRNALGAAVAAQHLAALKDLAALKAVVDTEQLWRCSFRELLESVLALQAARRPLVRLFRDLPERVQRQYIDALLALLLPSFQRAQEEGSLRADLEITDLALIFEMLDAALRSGPTALDRAEAAERLIRVILDGLFAARVDTADPRSAS